MAYKWLNGYWVNERVTNRDIRHSSNVKELYEKCKELSEKYDIPLEKFDLSTTDEYGTSGWCVEFTRPANDLEVAEAKGMEKFHADNRRKHYEQLKKEFGE